MSGYRSRTVSEAKGGDNMKLVKYFDSKAGKYITAWEFKVTQSGGKIHLAARSSKEEDLYWKFKKIAAGMEEKLHNGSEE